MSKYTIIAISTLLILAACSKSDGLFNGPKIHTITDFRSGQVSTYTYNADGTVAQIQKNANGKTVFTYVGDTVQMSDINTANVTTDGYWYVLNSNKYADTAIGQYQFQNNSSAYDYDGNGIINEQRYYTFGNLVSKDMYVKGGKNITEIYHLNTTNNYHTADYYSYFTSNSNTIGVQNEGKNYLGVSSTNLIQTKVSIGNNNDTTGIITYHYIYNSSSQVQSLSTYNRSGQLLDSIGYVYY